MQETEDVRDRCPRHLRNGGHCRHQWICEMTADPIKPLIPQPESWSQIFGRIKALAFFFGAHRHN